ncbi:sialate O-acetylesterase [Mucilaginibacter hurinus]|uniref:Sialate O-acetylesterase n=1 Tax=Mucilaginibacter hurinus TaxID=2201324 RepID=A0A367GRM6_9SPHI|nr:sialate O-acetylesterase [Mucilaginibacter hurinus]RCH55361.1 sialate O-acetylesterase [Mucilaginibacter hurinus]
MNLRFLILFVLTVFVVDTASAHIYNRPMPDSSFKVASPFQSNMVVQQGKPFTLWGEARYGQKVVIKASWANSAVTVKVNKSGYWRGQIAVPKAISGDFTPHTLTLYCNGTTIALNNLAIGEVWFAAGQSNMRYKMIGSKGDVDGVVDYETEIPLANCPNIRLLTVAMDFKARPHSTFSGNWVVCTPETVKEFSGVGYYFAREIQSKLNVPVGIILSAVGASSIQAWTRRETLAADTADEHLKRYDADAKSKLPLTPDFTFEKVVRPTLLYNAMVHPIAGFSLRGFLWYQGETNRWEGKKYTRSLSRMIQSWRDEFGQGSLPFYYVQVAPYLDRREDLVNDYYAIFREAQAEVRATENTEMAITLDSEDPKNIHPREKKPVGLRLARIALNKTYQIVTPYLGPQVSDITVEGSSLRLIYNKSTLAGGLATTDNKPPANFFIAGSDKVFYAANAVIAGDDIILQAGSVQKPLYLRYAFTSSVVTNLTNKAGLPAEQFRNDE